MITRTQAFPTGTYTVPTAQNLGRLVTHMLEVETEDNVVYWDTMNAWMPRPGNAYNGGVGAGQEVESPVASIFKLMAPTALTSHVVTRRR